MALETLRGIESVGEYSVNGKTSFIHIDTHANTLKFKIQDGPIKDEGLNGCQVDTVIMVATAIIVELNRKFPCRENGLAVTKLEEALMWMNRRTQDRKDRGVEGCNKA